MYSLCLRPGKAVHGKGVLHITLTSTAAVLAMAAHHLLIDEVGVEDVELVPLHDLGRRVVVVVVRLVVLVPFI